MSAGGTAGVVGTGLFARFRGQLAVTEETFMAFDYNISRIAAHITRRFINGMPEQRVHIIADPERVSPISGVTIMTACDRHVGFLSPQAGVGKYKMPQNFLFSSRVNNSCHVPLNEPIKEQ